MARSRKKPAAASAAANQAALVLGAVLVFVEQLQRLDYKPRAVQFEIDGLMYTSTKLPATKGLELWPRLTTLLGAGLTRAITTGDSGDLDGAALLRVAERAVQDGLIPIVRDLLASMQCGKLYTSGQPGHVLDDFDEHFAGEYGHLLKVAAFAVAHNLRGPTYGVR